MDVTMLDDDGNRYDPESVETEREPGRALLTVKHANPVPFSQGDRIQMIIASDTYEEGDISEIIKKRKEMKTVVGTCRMMLTEVTSQWEITHAAAVDEVLDADSTRFSITTFD